MATPFDHVVPPSSLRQGSTDHLASLWSDERLRSPFPTQLPPALQQRGWALDDYFGHPAAYHPEHGVVTRSHDGFVACPRNGRPHGGFSDLSNACAHCETAEPADPDVGCPLASAVSDLVSGPSLLIAGLVAALAFGIHLWVHHGVGL